jgi:hypothetical protein
MCLAAPESSGAQQFRDWLAGAQGIEAQQSIECVAAMSGPKQPPKLAKRNADNSRMGFAFLITTDDTTNRVLIRCDTNHILLILGPPIAGRATTGFLSVVF